MIEKMPAPEYPLSSPEVVATRVNAVMRKINEIIDDLNNKENDLDSLHIASDRNLEQIIALIGQKVEIADKSNKPIAEKKKK